MAWVGDNAVTAAGQASALRSPVQATAEQEIMRAKMQAALARRRSARSPYDSAFDQGQALRGSPMSPADLGGMQTVAGGQQGSPYPMPITSQSPSGSGYQPSASTRAGFAGAHPGMEL